MNRKVNSKTIQDIAKEWNLICHQRDAVIDTGKDISLTCVTAPCILSNLKEKTGSVLDLGCGTGYLTNKISQCCDICYGIDASENSIEIAKHKYTNSKIVFINNTIVDFQPNILFDVCVANMVFMTDPNLYDSLANVFKLLKSGGMLLATITHPCFWPIYWNYFNEPWFDYNTELFIQHDFTTSLSSSIGVTTHIHRPLSMYINLLKKVGFEIETLEELQPLYETPKEYRYEYPRFIFLKCKKAE